MQKKIICPECGNHFIYDMPKVRQISRKIYKAGRLENSLVLEEEPEALAQEYKGSDQLMQAGILACFSFGCLLCGFSLLDFWGWDMSPETIALSSASLSFLSGSRAYFILSQRDSFVSRISNQLAQLNPPQPEDGLRIEIKEEKSPANFTRYLGALPCSRDQFAGWARSAIAGASIAIGQWYGEGKPFSRKEYEGLLAYLETFPRGSPIIKKYKNGNQVTLRGQKMLQLILKEWGEAAPLP